MTGGRPERPLVGILGGMGPLASAAFVLTFRFFTGHPRWAEVAPRVRLPADPEQEELHRRLYGLKRGDPPAEMLPWMANLRARHGVSGFVFGCTEMHLVHEPLRGTEDWTIIDPLMSIARSTP